MKNFYKLLNGKKVTLGNDAINIASSPLDSSGTIIFIDGTKLDFLGGLSIESSRSGYIGRSVDGSIFSVKKSKDSENINDIININAKYFPIIGFNKAEDNTPNIGNTIFNFETLPNIEINDDNYNKETKVFSHTTKFKNLELGKNLDVTDSSVFEEDVAIKADTNVEALSSSSSEISTTINSKVIFGTDNNDDINTTLTINNSLSAKRIIFGPKGSTVIKGDTDISDLLTANKLIVKEGEEDGIKIGVKIIGSSKITGTLSDSSKAGNNLSVSKNTSSKTLEITSASIFDQNITIGDKTKQNTGGLEVFGNSILKANLNVAKDMNTMISGITITENNKLTANKGLKVELAVPTGNTIIFNNSLKINTLEGSESSENNELKRISITGASKSENLSSPNYNVNVSALSRIESILDINSKYPSLLTEFLGTDEIKSNLDTNTLEVTGRSRFNGNISITGNLIADSITLTNAEIIATSPDIDSSWLDKIPATAITPTTYKGSESDVTVSSTITVKNNIKFTEMTVNDTFNPTTLDETYTGTTGGSVITNAPVITDTLKLSKWTDNTNFEATKTDNSLIYDNTSKLVYENSKYNIYGNTINETGTVQDNYIGFAIKGDNTSRQYEFIESEEGSVNIFYNGDASDGTTNCTVITINGEFIESE